MNFYSEADVKMVRRVNKGQMFDRLGQLVVPWPMLDESYIFSRSGIQLETRSLFSDSLLYK